MVLIAGTELPCIAQPDGSATADLGVQPRFQHGGIAGNRSPRHRERIARVECHPRRRVHVAERMAPAGADAEIALEAAQYQRLAATQAQRAGGGAVALAGARQRDAAAVFLKRTAAQIGPGEARLGFQGERIHPPSMPSPVRWIPAQCWRRNRRAAPVAAAQGEAKAAAVLAVAVVYGGHGRGHGTDQLIQRVASVTGRSKSFTKRCNRRNAKPGI